MPHAAQNDRARSAARLAADNAHDWRQGQRVSTRRDVGESELGDGFDRIDVCTAYRFAGRTLTEFPSDVRQLEQCEPIYESMPGWRAPTRGARRFRDLPEAARNYIAMLEEVSGVPAAIVSTGSERDDTIMREGVMHLAEAGLRTG